MTITLDLSPEDEARLRDKAATHGQSVADYLKSIAQDEAAAEASLDAHRAIIEAPVLLPDPKTIAKAVQGAGGENTPLGRSVKEMLSRTPEQVREARARLFATARPARPLPPGKTLEDVVVGKWPGDETDHEVARGRLRIWGSDRRSVLPARHEHFCSRRSGQRDVAQNQNTL